MKDGVHLGFEIGGGAEIEIPIRHTAVTGQTQESGKTTTLEALISRSGLPAVAFVTKRGESSFLEARTIPPYFRERADWQFVSALLEATLRERLKFERSWIMRVSKGARTLSDVHRNVRKALETAKGLNENVYMTLDAYLQIVIPQIDKLPYESTLYLEPGLNVIDLSPYSSELQALVIRSVLEWVYEHEHNTIVIIPEAWEFIPLQRNSPVRLAAETFIRKSAGLKNYLWLDSQDIAGVASEVRRQIAVWILGVQRDEHEIERALKQIPRPKPKADEVMTLGKGEFFACFGKEMHRVYVQPAWSSEEDARKVATGKMQIDQLRHFVKAGASAQRAVNREIQKVEDDDMYKEKFEQAEETIRELQEEIRRLKSPAAKPAADRVQPATSGNAHANLDLDEIYAHVRQRILAEPKLLKIAMEVPEIEMSISRPVLEADHNSLRGRLAHLIAEKFFDSGATGSAAWTELKRRGFPTSKPNVYNELDRMAKMGFVYKTGEGYQKVEGTKIRVKNVAA